MKLKKFLILSSLLITLPKGFAENHLMLIGGGGEPDRDYTIFDSDIQKLSTNLAGSNWRYDVSYNGGHAKTERILQSGFNKGNKAPNDFTKSNYERLLEDYKAKILMGEIGEGEQLMIIISSHGAQRETRQKTHRISLKGGAATDLNNLSGSELASLDTLEEIVKLTKQRGIKLGIVDLSCHSGLTMSLKKDNPHACIVTSTGPEHFAFVGGSSFSNKFMENLKPGTTMEKAFLQARLTSYDSSYPMISTDEGFSIVNEIYNNITPYLYYSDNETTKLSDYVLNNHNPAILCQREDQFTKLISQIETLQKSSKAAMLNNQMEELKKLLKDYKASQDEIIRYSANSGSSLLNKKEYFTGAAPGAPVRTITFKNEEILKIDPDKRIAMATQYIKQSKNAKEKAEYQSIIEIFKKVKSHREKLLNQYPDMHNSVAKTKKMLELMGNTRNITEKIAAQEKRLYDEMYKQKQSLNFDDPCRQIAL